MQRAVRLLLGVLGVCTLLKPARTEYMASRLRLRGHSVPVARLSKNVS